MNNNLIKLLDKNLKYIVHDIFENTIYIKIRSLKETLSCTYCGYISNKTHSKYIRTFQYLPIKGMKTIIILDNRKMFCSNVRCKYKTFSEKFDFINDKAKKTKRLESEIVNVSLNMSSISASKYLKRNTVNVGKSTLCALLKKRDHKNR